MICRDEAATIFRAIASVRPWLAAYELSDTGSVDETVKVATVALAGLAGSIRSDPWQDFSQNRNLVLTRARQHGLPVLFLDCDDELTALEIADDTAVDWDILTVWAYDGSIRHRRVLAIQPDFDAAWHGSIHEELTWSRGLAPRIHHTAAFALRYNRDGARHQSGVQATASDLSALRLNVDKIPACVRSQYYLARTLHQAGMLEDARFEYEAYLRLEREPDETNFHALWSLAAILEALGSETTLIADKLDRAHRASPHRTEPLIMAARIHRCAGAFEEAYEYCVRALALAARKVDGDLECQLPDDDFVDTSYYGWRLYDELATNAILTGRTEIGRDACLRALNSPHLPVQARARVLHNLDLL